MSSGAPAPSDRNSLSIGSNGPLLLHDVHFLEQMAHFNREKVPGFWRHRTGDVAPHTAVKERKAVCRSNLSLPRPETRQTS